MSFAHMVAVAGGGQGQYGIFAAGKRQDEGVAIQACVPAGAGRCRVLVLEPQFEVIQTVAGCYFREGCQGKTAGVFVDGADVEMVDEGEGYAGFFQGEVAAGDEGEEGPQASQPIDDGM